MRALLVLYMVGVLKFGEAYGYGLYADFYGLIELGGILGALLSDRFLGIRRALLLGAMLMACGYFLLSLRFNPLTGFALVVVGSSLFGPNLIAHISQNEKRAPRGVLNIVFLLLSAGTYFATPLCAVFSENGVWPYGFWIASLGMLVVCLYMFFVRSSWEVKEITCPVPLSGSRGLALILVLGCGVLAVFVGIKNEAISHSILPWLEVLAFSGLVYMLWQAKLFTIKQVIALSCYLIALTLFYAFEEHFSDQASKVKSPVLGFTPMVFALEGPFDRFCRKVGSPSLKLALPFLVGAFSFFLLSLGQSAGYAIGGMSFIAIGEVMIGSVIYWSCVELYTNNLKSRELDKEAPLNLSQALPAPKELNLNKLSDAGGLKVSGCLTQSKTDSSDCLCMAPKTIHRGLEAKVFYLAALIFALATSLSGHLSKGTSHFSLSLSAILLLILGGLLGVFVRLSTTKKVQTL